MTSAYCPAMPKTVWVLALLVAARMGSVHCLRAPAPPPGLACVVTRSERACVDISEDCRRLQCTSAQVCARSTTNETLCLPASVRSFQNCQDQQFRLSQPCPADAGIVGFGQGCTFCRGANPFIVGPSIPPPIPEIAPSGSLKTNKACVFEKGCIDIASQCAGRNCPAGSECGLDHNELIECFPSATYKHCPDDQTRAFRPCPPGSFVLGYGQGCSFCTGGESARSARVETGPSPPAPPPTSLRISPPAPPPLSKVGPPAPPISPPSPPSPATPRACVYRHIRNGEFKRQCVDISDRCALKSCPPSTVCGLDLNEEVQCFPQSYKNSEFCGSENFLLSQPCPQDSGILGFGQGCNYCGGGSPFSDQLRDRPERRLAFSAASPAVRTPRVTGSIAPVPTTIGTPGAENACFKIHIGNLEFKSGCIDISSLCQQRNCPADTVCGLNLSEQIECFPASVRDFQNCGSEELRRTQPCPADSGVVGFGMGCTFCRGGNPFAPVPETTASPVAPESPTAPAPSSSSSTTVGFSSAATSPVASITEAGPVASTAAPGGNACIFSPSLGARCVDIAIECASLGCAGGDTCVVAINGQFTCLPVSASTIANCGSEELRKSQPCPADTGILGFGMGCTYCQGATFPSTPTPTPTPAPTPTPTPTPTAPAGSSLACVSRVTAGGKVRRGCLDLTELCTRRNCPADRTCALDAEEQPNCFAPSQLPISNCGSPNQRVAQPCPADTQVVAYGAGCTYCRGVGTVAPATAASRRACIVSGPLRKCVDISAICAPLRCDSRQVCALALNGEPRCFAPSELPVSNCASEMRRLDQPCPADLGAMAFGAGCTYCRP